MRCDFTKTTDDCSVDEGFVDYTVFAYCQFTPSLLPLALVILVWFISIVIYNHEYKLCKYALITLEYNLLYVPTNRCISKLLILLAPVGQSKAACICYTLLMYNLHMRHKIFCVTYRFFSKSAIVFSC